MIYSPTTGTRVRHGQSVTQKVTFPLDSILFSTYFQYSNVGGKIILTQDFSYRRLHMKGLLYVGLQSRWASPPRKRTEKFPHLACPSKADFVFMLIGPYML
jgi:hypothetical protein